ncbi:unnamed protein product, partial [marine sediment metagenome]
LISPWIDDAALFAREVLGLELTASQEAVLQSLGTHTKTAVKSCHGAGKTFLAAVAVLWFEFTRDPAEVVTTAPTGHQVRDLLWKEINKGWRLLPRELSACGECLMTRIKMLDADGQEKPGHVAYGFSTDDTDYFQGIHGEHLLVIVDEAAGVAEPIFEAIDTLGIGGEYRELLIGNPTSTKGTFREAFRDAALGYNPLTIAAEDTPNWTGEDVSDAVRQQLLQPAKVEEWRRKHGESSAWFQARVHAKFPTLDARDVIVPLQWMEDAQV